MNYYYFDILLAGASIALLIFLVGHLIYRRRFTHGGNLLLLLILILSTAGVSDLIMRWNPNPLLILFAESLNIFCSLFALTVLLHFSLFSFTRSGRIWAHGMYMVLYLPAVAISFLHSLTPLMVSGIVYNPFGFRLIYNQGYWAIIVLGALLGLTALGLEFNILFRKGSVNQRNEALLSIIILALLSYFFSATVVRPFFYHSLSLIGPLPTTLASVLLVYEFVKYHFFSLEKL